MHDIANSFTFPINYEFEDSVVEREIASLKVKCENYMVGCDWEGLFKQLMVCPTIL